MDNSHSDQASLMKKSDKVKLSLLAIILTIVFVFIVPIGAMILLYMSREDDHDDDDY